MRVSCALAQRELSDKDVDIIVFPEGVDRREIEDAGLSYPDAFVVGAIAENGRSRGVLLHCGRNQIDYLKVESDGRAEGTGNTQQKPVYEYGCACIGILICKDIDNVEFSAAVFESLRSSSARLKVLCIPADMGSQWLSGDSLQFPKRFEGVHVILCNHIQTHQSRCKSFITDTKGKKIVVQQDREPIYGELP